MFLPYELPPWDEFQGSKSAEEKAKHQSTNRFMAALLVMLKT